jgi:hypothetical protein
MLRKRNEALRNRKPMIKLEPSGALFSLMCVRSITREPLFIGGPGYDQIPQLHLFCSWQTALHALQGYNSNSPPLTVLQRVFVRPSHLYTWHLLSLLRTAPLYTSDALTFHGAPLTEPKLLLAPHLRRRTSPRRRPDHVGLPRRSARPAFRPASERTRRVAFPTYPHLRRRRSASFGIAKGRNCTYETTLI